MVARQVYQHSKSIDVRAVPEFLGSTRIVGSPAVGMVSDCLSPLHSLDFTWNCS